MSERWRAGQGRRWMLALSCDDVPTNPLPATGCHAGIDLGIVSFATISDGKHIDNPRWGRVAADRLGAAQQWLARAKRGSKNRVLRRNTVAARHRKIANRHTSDGCEQCGHVAAENRVKRAEFECQRCLHRAPADEHAARNILRAGLALHAQKAGEQAGGCAPPEKSLTTVCRTATDRALFEG